MNEQPNKPKREFEDILGWAEVMRLANLPPSRARKLAKEGKIKPDFKCGSLWMFRPASVQKLIQEYNPPTANP